MSRSNQDQVKTESRSCEGNPKIRSSSDQAQLKISSWPIQGQCQDKVKVK